MTNIQIKKERIKSLLFIFIIFYNYAITSTGIVLDVALPDAV